MENKISKETFSLLFLSVSKSIKDLKQLGNNIGKRLVEDFVFKTTAVSKMFPQKIPENVALFFTVYFSHTPRHEHNVVFLHDFWAINNSVEGLFLFQGVLEEIYKHLCDLPVDFEVDESRRIIMVKF